MAVKGMKIGAVKFTVVFFMKIHKLTYISFDNSAAELVVYVCI